VLHGTSSLSHEDLFLLRNDGIAKVNIWTVLEVKTSQDMTVELIRRLKKILPAVRIKELVDEGVVGNKFAGNSAENCELGYLTEVYRRDVLKVPSVAKMVAEFMGAFGYNGLVR
jgi:hypothetical protein